MHNGCGVVWLRKYGGRLVSVGLTLYFSWGFVVQQNSNLSRGSHISSNQANTNIPCPASLFTLKMAFTAFPPVFKNAVFNFLHCAMVKYYRQNSIFSTETRIFSTAPSLIYLVMSHKNCKSFTNFVQK